MFINLGLTFKAVSRVGDLIGVISNEIVARDSEERTNCSSDIAEDQEGSVKFKEFMTLFQKVEQESDIFERYPDVNRIMDIKAVAVNEAFRGQGVCKALFYKIKYVTHTQFLNDIDCSILCTQHNDNLLSRIYRYKQNQRFRISHTYTFSFSRFRNKLICGVADYILKNYFRYKNG